METDTPYKKTVNFRETHFNLEYLLIDIRRKKQQIYDYSERLAVLKFSSEIS